MRLDFHVDKHTQHVDTNLSASNLTSTEVLDTVQVATPTAGSNKQVYLAVVLTNVGGGQAGSGAVGI